MTRYTPTEIILAGINDARETFAHLYVELDNLRAAAAYNYHLAFVDVDVDVDRCERGRLPFHPAPAGFGGNELAIRTRRVNLAGLTDAGLSLYQHGIRTGLAEREQLLEQITIARHDLERMLDAIDGTPTKTAKHVAKLITVDANRTPQSATRQLDAWDVPVRIPGTTTTLPAATAHTAA